MWQNSPGSSRSPWVQLLKDVMKKPDSDPPKSVEVDAETEVLGRVSSPESPSGSSCGIPDNFFGVVDEPEFPSGVGCLIVCEHRCTCTIVVDQEMYVLIPIATVKFVQDSPCSLALTLPQLRTAIATVTSGNKTQLSLIPSAMMRSQSLREGSWSSMSLSPHMQKTPLQRRVNPIMSNRPWPSSTQRTWVSCKTVQC